MIQLKTLAGATALSFLLSVLTAGSSFAQSAGERSPDPFIAQGLAALEGLMQSAVRDGRAPSAIAMLARDDELLWLKTVGDMGPGVPMRSDAILPLASVGKMYTAVAAMILVERKKIALDDRVAKYIPEFAGLGITVHHLLTHTSGLTVRGDTFWAAWNAHSEKTTATELAKALAALPIQSKPGERFDYGPTGASYEVLGAVIEIASGQTLEAFMTQNIFEPLGLSDSCFYIPAEQAQRLPAFFRNVDGVLRPDRAQGEDFPRSTYFHGGGGVQASPRDIQRFARLFLNGGAVDGVRVLRPDSIRLMMTDHLGDKAPPGYTWGYGAALIKGAAGEIAQYGWSGGGYATLWVDPRERLIGYFAFPVMPPGDHALLDEFRRLLYQAL